MFSRAFERRQQVERLEDEADALAADAGQLAVGQRPEVDVAEEHVAGGQRVEPGEAVHQRALAGAGRAHDGGEAAGREADGDVVEGEDLVAAAAVDLGGVLGAGGEGDRGGPRGQRLGGEEGANVVMAPTVTIARRPSDGASRCLAPGVVPTGSGRDVGGGRPEDPDQVGRGDAEIEPARPPLT